MNKGVKIIIKAEKGYKAHTIVMGMYTAQSIMMHELQAIKDEDLHDNLLFLHAIELNALFLKMSAKNQNRYTITLTDLQAEAFRQMWGRVELKYEQYGAVWVQWLLDEVNSYMTERQRLLAAAPDYKQMIGTI